MYPIPRTTYTTPHHTSQIAAAAMAPMTTSAPIQPSRSRRMPRMVARAAASVALVALAAGCATPQERVARWDHQRMMYQLYAGQQRTYSAVSVQGTNLTWSITGATSITMDAPLHALGAPEREPTGGEVAAQIIAGGVPWVAGAIVGHQAMRRQSTATHTSHNSHTETLIEPPEAVAPDTPAAGPVRPRARVGGGE